MDASHPAQYPHNFLVKGGNAIVNPANNGITQLTAGAVAFIICLSSTGVELHGGQFKSAVATAFQITHRQPPLQPHSAQRKQSSHCCLHLLQGRHHGMLANSIAALISWATLPTSSNTSVIRCFEICLRARVTSPVFQLRHIISPIFFLKRKA